MRMIPVVIPVIPVAMLASGCLIQVGGGETAWQFDAPAKVEVLVSNGDIDVVSAPGATLFAAWDGGGFGENARPDVFEMSDGTLVLDANGGLLGGGTMTVEVPDGTDLDLVVERGAIDVQLDNPANIGACVAAGSISLGLPPGPYELDVGIGVGAIDSDIWHEPGAPWRVEVCLGAGDVDIYAW